MSALTPHIRVLRAEATALTEQAQLALQGAQVAVDHGNIESAKVESVAATICVRLSAAKLAAVEQLEAEEQALLDTLTQGTETT